MTRFSTIASLPTLSLLAAGCVMDVAEEETIDDSEVAIAGLDEGSPEAGGVLNAANVGSFTELDVDAKLTSTAARSIVNYRNGSDGIAGTADDRQYATLAELDAQPYVATTAIKQLLAYAHAKGWVTAGLFPICAGTPKFPTTGKLVIKGGTKSTFTRDCDAFGDCTEWTKFGNDVALTITHIPSLSYIDTGALAWFNVFTSKRISDSSSIYEETDVFLNRNDCFSEPIGYVPMDRQTGSARGFMHSRSRVYQGGWYTDWSDCNTPLRPVAVRLGSTCVSITDDDPQTNYGHQEKHIVQLTW
jgi:hypothetical protein